MRNYCVYQVKGAADKRCVMKLLKCVIIKHSFLQKFDPGDQKSVFNSTFETTENYE